MPPWRELTLALGLGACSRHPAHSSAPPVLPPPAVSLARTDDWIPFRPARDRFDARSSIDLRALNQRRAGDDGFVVARKGQLFFGTSERPVRFWGVNGPASTRLDDLRREARQLAKYGVNLVRHPLEPLDAHAELDPTAGRRTADLVDALASEGIYTHLSLFFPTYWRPPANLPWLAGYDGKQGAPAVLFFNPELQQRYRSWWRALLLAKSAHGRRLIDDPALFGVELVNEDSLLFWTFSAEGLPEAQRQLIEAQFAHWLERRFGSLDQALARWNGPKTDRDRPAEGRMGLRPLWEITHQRTLRDQDTVRFLVETQRRFYQEQVDFLRGLGFHGLINTSNWVTASPQRLGPLEEYSYTVGDLIDRHGYFTCASRGDEADWSVREGQSYIDRSAWRFAEEDPESSSARPFVAHPAMEIGYDDKPSMISEVTWNRPNRYRSEAPLYLAVYGALQDTDALVHFTKDGTEWSVKPRFFVQPWTLTSPAMMGQFPAAALIYRQGLVHTAAPVADLTLGLDDLFALRGTPLPEQAALDDLRRKDLPRGAGESAADLIDPLVHYVGRSHVTFAPHAAPPKLVPLDRFIDARAHKVISQTGELTLDHGRGFLTIAAAGVEGASGNLAAAGTLTLPHLTIETPLDLAHVVLVSLDGAPVSSSKRLLLQVMSEEKPSGFRADPVGQGRLQIRALGQDPWLIRALHGTVRIERPDAGALRVEALDPLGIPTGRIQTAAAITLEPATLYYLVTPSS